MNLVFADFFLICVLLLVLYSPGLQLKVSRVFDATRWIQMPTGLLVSEVRGQRNKNKEGLSLAIISPRVEGYMRPQAVPISWIRVEDDQLHDMGRVSGHLFTL